MESEAKILQAIFDHAALGVAKIKLDRSWLRVNNRYCETLGRHTGTDTARRRFEISLRERIRMNSRSS
jgi:hypothetical protein